MLIRTDQSGLTPARPLACFFAQAAFSTAFTYLTSGVFLSGIAILIGAGDVLVSYLSIILNICGVLILFLSPFLERFRSRKRLTLALTILSRLATVLIAAVPALVPAGGRLPVFLAVVVVAFTLQAQTTVALNQWMLAFVEGERSGRYIALRQTLILAVTVVLSVAGGYFMDYMEGRYTGFLLLSLFAAAMGCVEVLLLARTPDGPPYRSKKGRFRFRELVRSPSGTAALRGLWPTSPSSTCSSISRTASPWSS